MWISKKTSALIITGFFLALSGFEVWHDLIARAVWPGFTKGVDDVVFILVPVWLTAAICVWLRGPIAAFWTLIGVLAALTHGVVTRLGLATEGLYILGASIVMIPFAAYVFWPPDRESMHGREAFRPGYTVSDHEPPQDLAA